jgi:hypothetical protein
MYFKVIIGKFLWTYLDDISIHSNTIADYIGHIRVVYQCCQDDRLNVLPKKCNFFAKKLNVLDTTSMRKVYTYTKKIW